MSWADRLPPGNIRPDCGDNSCMYTEHKGGMRTNGGCHCDECPRCSAPVVPGLAPKRHYWWCPIQDWIPEHYRGRV